MRRKNLSCFILIFLIFIITACGSQGAINNGDGEEEIKEEAVEDYEAVEGGVLRTSISRFNTLNPLYNKNYSLFQLHHLIYDSLVSFDENMDVQASIAKDWIIAEDGQSIEFHLQEGVLWHDGQALTAQDVIFTINLIKGNISNTLGNSVFKTSLQQISDVREIKEGVVNVTFSRPFSNGLEAMTFPILPKHLFEGVNIDKLDALDFPMIGTGPYRLKTYETMREIRLIRNDEYWGTRPYIDEIQVMIVPDTEAQLSVFENGDIDLAQPISIDWAKYAEKNDVNIYEYISNNYEFIGFNFKNKILREKNIRMAIAYAIDRHEMLNNIYLGHGTVVDVPIYPYSSIYLQGNLKYGYNVNKTTDLLEKSGFTMEGDNLIRSSEDGQSLTFKLISNKDNILREKTAFYIQEELAKVGIGIDVELLDWEDFNDRIDRGDFDMVLGGWELSYLPDLSFAFHSSQIGQGNFISYEDQLMDDLLERAFTAPNKEDKIKAYENLQKHLVKELPYFSLFYKNGSIVVRDRVKGNFKANHYNLFAGIEEWFIIDN